MKHLLTYLSASVVLSAASFSAQAQFAKTEDAVKYRQSAFTLMGNHMGRLSAMARGQAPFDAAKAQESARLIETLSKLPWEAFPPGSKTKNSELKGDPWKDAAEFKQLQDKFQAEVVKFPASVATVEGLRAQLAAVGATCKACHDKFKE